MTNQNKATKEIHFEQLETAWARYRDALEKLEETMGEALDAFSELDALWEQYFAQRPPDKLN